MLFPDTDPYGRRSSAVWSAAGGIPFALDIEAFATQLVENMAWQDNGKVVFVARPGRFDPLIHVLRQKVEEAGGKVGGGCVRWNFFTDPTVTVGEEIWVVDGKAVK